MFLDSPLWTQAMFLIGEVTVFLILGMFVASLALIFIMTLSIQRGKVYFPRLIKSGMVFLEGMVRGICKFFGVDDQHHIKFSIRPVNTKK